MTTYPKGTPINTITNFDRSTKVVIECPNHPDNKWTTKEPATSRWFTHHTNSDAFGNPLHDCDCAINNFITSEEYTS